MSIEDCILKNNLNRSIKRVERNIGEYVGGRCAGDGAVLFDFVYLSFKDPRISVAHSSKRWDG